MVEKFMVEYSEVGKVRVWYILQPIKKAFRKKSLSCHPDKHPNDPNAVDNICSTVSSSKTFNWTIWVPKQFNLWWSLWWTKINICSTMDFKFNLTVTKCQSKDMNNSQLKYLHKIDLHRSISLGGQLFFWWFYVNCF